MPAKKSGTQSLSLSKAEHVSQHAILPRFVIHMPLCLHVLFHVTGPLHSNLGLGSSLGVCSLGGARILSRAGDYYAPGGGGLPLSICLPLHIYLLMPPCHMCTHGSPQVWQFPTA